MLSFDEAGLLEALARTTVAVASTVMSIRYRPWYVDNGSQHRLLSVTSQARLMRNESSEGTPVMGSLFGLCKK
ncbi:MAG TPA: hypothetical protein DIT18_03150 [Pseudomonas sp.]|nr:hypothetical protein [Pseudomonas sp.]